MSKSIHKGTELNNVKETWERNGQNQNEEVAANNDLQQTIQKEAEEYDEANKEERILGGERASVDDASDE